jgi:Na+-transporting NADH:ubiquinone oxidoreductase subunit NqrF
MVKITGRAASIPAAAPKAHDAPFLEELEMLEKENPNYKFIGAMTEMAKSSRTWGGETGFINLEMLKKYVDDLPAPLYYIAGPPGMVTAMQKMLSDAGIDSDNVRFEEFAGY